MTTSVGTTWKATLIGTVVGTGAWLQGIGDRIWPSHPQLAVFFLTFVVTVVMTQILAAEEPGRKSPPDLSR